MTSNLHPIFELALAPWAPPAQEHRTEQQEQAWIDADTEAMRRKREDPFRQREADAAMRRELDFDQMQRSLK